MADLPSSIAGQTLNVPIMPLPDPNSGAYSVTPAIQALQNAAQAGVISFDQIFKRFQQGRRDRAERQLLEEEEQNSRDRLEIAPLKKQLTKDQLTGDIQILPKQNQYRSGALDLGIDEIGAKRSLLPGQTQLEKDKLGAATQILPKQTEATLGRLDSDIQINPLKTQVEKSGLNAALPAAKLAEKEMQDDPTGVRSQARQIFSALYPGQALPTLPDGSLDYDRMSAQAAPYLQLQRLYSTEQGKAAMKAVEDKKRWDLLFDAKSGLPRHPNDVLRDAASAAPPMKAEDVGANASAVADIDHTIDDIRKARETINSGNEPVGPGLGQGSVPNQIFNKGKALLGGDNKKFDEQQRLTKTLAGGILTSIQSLRGLGQIRNTEIEWLEKHQPDLSSTKEFWHDWLNKSEDLLRRGREVKLQTLPGDVSKTVTKPSEVPHTPTAAPEGSVKVGSVEEAMKLRPGVRFVLPDGTSGVAH